MFCPDANYRRYVAPRQSPIHHTTTISGGDWFLVSVLHSVFNCINGKITHAYRLFFHLSSYSLILSLCSRLNWAVFYQFSIANIVLYRIFPSLQPFSFIHCLQLVTKKKQNRIRNTLTLFTAVQFHLHTLFSLTMCGTKMGPKN